ncbi:MAG: hydrogenase 3 maturation endopeptidase HyCI [Candidatus Saganbacteria bacterium]|nr:hydrogenase 3 maturation endopeptidase HyCI [Candidatus Saganbacteria bacterium]
MLKELAGKLTARSLIIGIGNTIKGDDGLGPKLIKRLEGEIACRLIDAGPAPENYIGKIRNLQPDTIVIVDAIDMGLKPGKFKIVPSSKIGNATFTTHSISIKTFVDFILSEMSPSIFILGVQPAKIAFGASISEPVQKALRSLGKELIECMS